MPRTQPGPARGDPQLTGFSAGKAQSHYLEEQMKKVSRSFALVVSYLEQPLRDYLSAAYLICRVVDNIEDTVHSYAWQQQRFDELCVLLRSPDTADEILAGWDAEHWPELTDNERQLVGPGQGRLLWQIYEAMPTQARQAIIRWVGDMVQGMTRIEDPGQEPRRVQRDRVQVLASKPDYDRYCYYVAGTVGYLATELAVAFYGMSGPYVGRLFATCEACGRGLQKTNIVKDFRKDLSRGVSFLPDEWLRLADYRPLALSGAPSGWTRLVIDDVLADLRDATHYVLALPYEVTGYRIASLLCLFPAYQTLLQAAEQANRLFTGDHNFKISRFTMLNCIRDARSLVRDNQAVLAYSRAAEGAIVSLLG